MAQVRQREVELEEDRPGKAGGGEVVMVGGMDNLVGNANEEIEIELDSTPRKKEVVADIEETDQDKDARLQEVEEDARLAYDDSERGTEERQSRRTRRNRARREAIGTKDAMIEALSQKVDYLTGVIGGVTKGQAHLTLNTLDSQLGAAQQALQMADEELARAVASSDGEKFREIQKLRDEASARVFQLSNARQRLIYEAQAGGAVPSQMGQRTPQQQAQTALSSKAADYTETFMSRFPYFDPNGADEDSMMIRAIDDAVAAEGYRPDTPLYWRTLEQRLAARGFMPDKSDDADNDSPAPVRQMARSAGMPPTSSGRNTRRGTSNTFALDPMMREYLEGEGLLDPNIAPEQKQRRDRLIQQWRNNQQRAKRGEFNRS